MNFLKYKKIYFTISLILIAFSTFSLLNWGLRLGVDFRGGSIIEYSFEEEISTEDAILEIEDAGVEVSSVQSTGDNSYLFRLPPITPEEKVSVQEALDGLVEGNVEELRFETVGPSIGPDLVRKTIYAISFASIAILIWIAIQFKSFKFGVTAIIAMFHDSFILLGSFAALGHYFTAEVDFLFVTALLTTLSFSVHDTIVVFDRIREIQKKYGGELKKISNRALAETMVRSLNNSFTILFMLTALILLGGTTIKWFAVALFVGTILGTYSSPFVAVPLLTSWDDVFKKLKR